MYIENCNTGSQPRKAISHIFGRNKLCTRMIPNHVWVHFCRKHYQRSRYRNGHEYAKLQIDLVIQQIERVQTWSDENKNAGKSNVVTSWSLQPRKREQKRLEVKQENKKRTFQQEDSDDDIDNAVMNGTAVPDWLQQRFASGYDTNTIMTIVQQLRTEIHGNQLTQIPDIEILPSISSDGSEDKPKQHMKRKTSSSATSHKRSQSMGTALRQDFQPMARRSSQGGAYTFGEGPGAFAGKRVRTDEAGYFVDRHSDASRPPTLNLRSMQVAFREPARGMGNIREDFNEDNYGQPNPSAYSYGPGPVQHTGQGGPLPAPTPQRRPSQSTASHLEASSNVAGYQDPRRAYHQRSQSDASSFYPPTSGSYRPSSSSEYPAPPYTYTTSGGQYDQYLQGYSRPEENYFPAAAHAGQGVPVSQAPASSYYDETSSRPQYAYAPAPYYSVNPAASQMPGSRHSRHQSNPNVARPQDYAQAPNVAGRYEAVYERGAMEQPRQPYDAQARQPPPTVMEDDPARGLYAGRR